MKRIVKEYDHPEEIVEIHSYFPSPSRIYVAVSDKDDIYKLSYFEQYHWRPLYRTDAGSIGSGASSSLKDILRSALNNERITKVLEFQDIKEFAEWLVKNT